MDLKEAREKIDSIDDEMTRLFVERMNTAKEIAAYKAEHKLQVFDRERERAVLNRIEDKVGPELESYANVLYSTLFDVSRSYQHRSLKTESKLGEEINKALSETPAVFPGRAIVACQGVEGSYTQSACDRLFNTPSIMYFNNFKSVFQAVESGLCRYGVLPIENSTAGSVNEVYDLMKKHKFYIVRSTKLQITHSLLAKKGTKLSDVKEIYSKDIALDQCSDYLGSLKGVKLKVCENTATAARMVSESDRNDVACVSSRNCAELYGLTSLCDGIQNNENNYTRFICISKNLEIYPGSDKTSLMFSVPHKPGSLYHVVSRFSALGLNLTKLESRPMPNTDFQFLFYFDLDANIHDEKVQRLLCEFDDEYERFTYFGSYMETT